MSIKTDLQTIKNAFSNYQLLNLKLLYKGDKIAAKMAINSLVDNLSKDGIISQKTSQNVYLSLNKHDDLVLYCCSYSLKLA